MKRNLFPLLGIAFVVALAVSGIFYGLFVSQLKQAALGNAQRRLVVAAHTLDRGAVLKTSDLRLSSWAGVPPPGAFHKIDEAAGKTIYAGMEENEPVTESRVSAAHANGGLGIAKGMRALSVRVVDSAGLVPFLRSGHRVDVQAVENRNSPQAMLRTILQNVEVLNVQIPEGNPNQAAPAVVTLLASPVDADRVALADSGANVRLLLRNPVDEEQRAAPNLLLASVFLESPVAGRLQAGMELLIRVGGATPQVIQELRASVPELHSGSATQVVALPKNRKTESLWASLTRNQGLQEVLVSRVIAPSQRTTSLYAGKHFNLRFAPGATGNGSARLRVQPEINAGGPPESSTDLSLVDGQSFIVTGPELIAIVTARLHSGT